MKPSQIAELAAALAAGSITADAISEKFGESVLGEVVGFGMGVAAGSVVPTVMRETGVSCLIDDIFDFF